MKGVLFKRKVIIFLLSSIVTLTFCLSLIVRAFNNAVDYDDAYNISIAKNIALGFGYVSSYEDYIYFNSEVTTGPVLILPASLLIKLFGNVMWIPNIIIVLITFIQLSLILLIKYTDKLKRLLIHIFFIILSVAFIPLNFFYSFLGEIPSALFIIISALYLRSKSIHSYFISGIFFSLAFFTKSITVLFIIGVCIVGIINLVNALRNKKNLKTEFIIIFSFLIAFIFSYTIYGIFKTFFYPTHIDISPSSLSENGFFLDASGLKKIIEITSNRARFEYIIDNFINNFSVLQGYLGGGFHLLLFLGFNFAVQILALRQMLNKEKRRLKTVLFLLSCNINIHLLWWLTLSHTGWTRHLSQIFIYFAFILSLCVIKSKRFYQLILIGVGTLFILNGINNYFLLFRIETNKRYIPLMETKNYLENLKKTNPNIIFLGCGWWANRDLEYVLSTTLNFGNCYNVTQEFLNKNEVYLVRSDIFNWGNEPYITNFANECDKTGIIYTNSPFVISRCKTDVRGW